MTTPNMPETDITSDPKKTYTAAIIRWVVVAGMILAGIIVYPHLPDRIPTHWGIHGEVNGWSNRWPGAFIAPIMGIIFLILFPFLQRIDPKRRNYGNFQQAWEGIQTLLVLFFAYIQGVTYVATLRQVDSNFVGQSIMVGIGILFIVLGNYMGKVRQNWFVGIRTPWALEDPVVWQKTQRIGGWAFVIGGIAILLMSLTMPPNPYIFMGIIAVIALGPIVYSYVIAKKMGVMKK